jgi:hypothetical protein
MTNFPSSSVRDRMQVHPNAKLPFVAQQYNSQRVSSIPSPIKIGATKFPKHGSDVLHSYESSVDETLLISNADRSKSVSGAGN